LTAIMTTKPSLHRPDLHCMAPLLVVLALAACAPTVKIEAPDRPIEINLNVRIEQEVRVRLERDVDSAIRNDPALFGLPPAVVKGKTP